MVYIKSGRILIMSEDQEFIQAIEKGNEQKALAMLENHPQLAEAANPAGVTALLLARYMGLPALAEQISLRKPRLSFYEAVVLGRLEAVSAWVDSDPLLVNQLSPDGFPPLGLAAFFGQLAVLQYLLELGADPNLSASNAMRVAPLHSAVAYGDPQVACAMARLLVEGGAQVNAVQQGGWTPLHEAADNNQFETAELLLSNGADPDATNDDGLTPLALARRKSFDQMAAFLTQHGASI
jgi:ankyrin repeat protein